MSHPLQPNVLTRPKIVVGLGSCGIAAGGKKVHEALVKEVSKRKLDVDIDETGCIGMCFREVLVEIRDPKRGSFIYGDVTPDRLPRILDEHVLAGRVIPEWLAKSDELPGSEDAFFAKQRRIVLRHCGVNNPESLAEYQARGGYAALAKVLKELTPEQVIETITQSGLRGRGGAGFPTGIKWKFARQSRDEIKYVVCNGDEGDPGAFMDRSVLEGDPHNILEGMLIAGYAIGARFGYIYCRAEYPLAVKRLKLAIEVARQNGFLGERILDSAFSFDIKVKEGAGAFVCGEETALIASIEGQRGMPRLRPPFPTTAGLWAHPTSINNVETFGNVPWIILNGADKFAEMGVGKSRGTKVFALAGKIVRGGLIEVPMGITLREIIYEVGGGIQGGKAFKAVQMGGPSGGCIPAALIDTPVDYESVTQTGAIMGSGGMVVMDETTCMVDVARFFLNFTQKESCGKCTFCRLGTKRMLEILTRITEGSGRPEDIPMLEELSEKIKKGSLCGLGQTAPNPVLTTLKYFRHEYEAHINDKKCPAHRCKKLLTYSIIADKCTGCTVCAKNCPVHCISGERKQVHVIDQAACIRCGECLRRCNFAAVLAD